MTYKKASRLINAMFRSYGYRLSKSASQQLGYLMLFATEGEVSKAMHHDLKQIVKQWPCSKSQSFWEDDPLIEQMEEVLQGLTIEEEVTVGWILKMIREKGIWKKFRLATS